jgi:UrcA family protein
MGERLHSKQWGLREEEFVMTRTMFRTVAAAGLSATVLLATTVLAEPVSITVRHVNLQPATPAAARHAFLKIDEAALRVCGASAFSLAEAKTAMRATPCWQKAAGTAALQSGNPLLAQAFDRFAPRGTPESRLNQGIVETDKTGWRRAISGAGSPEWAGAASRHGNGTGHR